jgi:hypothetical protein
MLIYYMLRYDQQSQNRTYQGIKECLKQIFIQPFVKHATFALNWMGDNKP